MNLYRISPVLCCLSFGAPFSAVAQSEAPLTDAYLDELVITGTRSERRLLDTPVRTEVVTSKELEKTHARNVKEALDNVPGLQLREIHGKAGFEVWLQGVDSDRVLVLIDGMPMTATTGSTVDVSQIAALDIERIEVVKGATSAQYGSSAIGGVVNIITRPPESGFSGDFTTDAGTYRDQNPSGEKYEPSRFSTRAKIEGGKEALAFRLSGSHQHTDGIDPSPDDWSMPGDEIDRSDLNLRGDWLPGPDDKHRLSGALNLFEEESISRYTAFSPPSTYTNQRKDETVERSRFVLSGDHESNVGFTFGWSAIHERLNDDTVKYTPSRRFNDRNAESLLSKASLHIGQTTPFNHFLQGGLDFSKESLSQHVDGSSELGDSGKRERENQEIWLQDTWIPTDSLEVVPGIRFQHDSDFGTHTAPKINVRSDLIKTGALQAFLRAGVGAGYRVPNLKERFYVFDHSELGYIVEGYEELQPEESVSYQFGGGLSWHRNVWLEANAFFNDIEQLIQTYNTGEVNNGVRLFRYENVAEARTWGLETTAGWDAPDAWQVTAGYTLLYSEDLETGKELNKRPRHQMNLGVDGPLYTPNLTWSIRVRYQNEEFADAENGIKSPGYTTADFKLNYQFSDQLRLFGGVDNATDEQRDFSRPNEDFRPVAGRFAYAGLSLSFGH